MTDPICTSDLNVAVVALLVALTTLVNVAVVFYRTRTLLQVLSAK